jgi:hypothetical protein
MTNIFTLENNSDFSEKINLDELYEKKKQYDLIQLSLYNKILNRIHVKIKTIAKKNKDQLFCWYLVPEIIIGVPKFDQGACIAYLIDKLKVNGFAVRYIHPNTMFICWKNFVPTYVRDEIKKKTGIIIDEYGRRIDNSEKNQDPEEVRKNINGSIFNVNNINPEQTNKPVIPKQQNQRKFTPINSYKPSGNFVYDEELINNLGNKLS